MRGWGEVGRWSSLLNRFISRHSSSSGKYILCTMYCSEIFIIGATYLSLFKGFCGQTGLMFMTRQGFPVPSPLCNPVMQVLMKAFRYAGKERIQYRTVMDKVIFLFLGRIIHLEIVFQRGKAATNREFRETGCKTNTDSYTIVLLYPTFGRFWIAAHSFS